MLKAQNYNRVINLINYIHNLNEETTNAIKPHLHKVPEEDAIDFRSKTICLPSLANQLKNNNLFEPFIDADSDAIPLDVYLYLSIQEISIAGQADYKQLLATIRATPSYKAFPKVHEHLEFVYLTECLISNSIHWTEFTKKFDASNWSEIYLLAEILPVSNTTLDEFIKWISLILEKQEKDGALAGIGQYIYQWVILSKNVFNEIENRLVEIATDNRINRFFTPLLKGIKEKQDKDILHYILKLKDHIETSNAFNILYAIGSISLADNEFKNQYYNLLTEKISNKKLTVHEFINLCNYFQLYRKELFENVENVLPTSENTDFLFAVIALLENDKQNKIDKDWQKDTCILLFSKKIAALRYSLDHFLHSIADNDLYFSYDLLEFRFKIMAHMEMLETALVYMVQKDIFLFQKKLIAWINQEDSYLHTAVRKICSLYELGKSLFEIPATIFDSYNAKDKLFISYKIVGYVYSMDELQRLILSLIESIKERNEVLRESMHYILSEYLVYNYRSTLELIKENMKHNGINDFAQELYEQIVEEYETYFDKLKNISVDKELRPYKEHILLKNFYMKKIYSNISKEAKRGSIAGFFKNTQLNSNKWAMRRSDEFRHKVQELGHYSVSTEFPSGEYLNPIYQEYIRRTYQKIRKDEINTD